jgi:exonuclease III
MDKDLGNKVATWNVRGIAEKMEELQTELLKRNIGKYVMNYSGVPANHWASSGVVIVIRKDWKHGIQDYTWISDRIIETRIQILNRNFTIVGVYVLVEGKEQDTEEFYRDLQQSMDKIPKKENILVAGDFNGRIDNQPNPECIGENGVRSIMGVNSRSLCRPVFNKWKLLTVPAQYILSLMTFFTEF